MTSSDDTSPTPAKDGGAAAHVTPDTNASLSKGASSECADGIEVLEPTVNDVLCGRGGSINAHPGNERFRTLVEKRKRVYLTARFKREKRLIASSIVSEIRALEPPGRFLTKNSKTGKWVDIGDEKARDKTSQALRENAPTLRAEIEEEISEQRAELQSSVPKQIPPPASYYPWPYPYPYYAYAQQPPPPNGQPSPYAAAQQPPSAQAPPQLPPPSQPQPAYPPAPPGQWHPAAGATSPHPEQQQSQQQYAEQQQQQQRQQQYATNAYTNAQQQQQQPDDDEKSIFDQTFEAMSSVMNESLSSWAKTFNLAGAASVASNQDDRLETSSVASKPIVYVHQPEDDSRSLPPRNRAVHFKDDSSASSRKPPRVLQRSHINYPKRPKRNRPFGSGSSQNGNLQQPTQQQRPGVAPVSTVQVSGDNDNMISLMTTEGMNSIVEEGPIYDMGEGFVDHTRSRMPRHPHELEYKDCEPVPIVPNLRKRLGPRRASMNSTATDDGNSSMFEQVANQIVMGMGSWDNSVLCNSEAGPGLPGPKQAGRNGETMAVEIEGQEVQLVDMMDQEEEPIPYVDPRDHRRRAPDDSRVSPEKQRMEMDWPSRVGSCHSWIPESLAHTSLFSANSRQSSINLSPDVSMDMDVSSATDPFSCTGSIGGSIGGNSVMGGSIGGGSLCKVFDAEISTPRRGQSVAHALPSPDMSSRVLRQVPSWERSLRSRSPLSIGAEEDDVQTKGSEKLMGDSISITEDKMNASGMTGMTWE